SRTRIRNAPLIASEGTSRCHSLRRRTHSRAPAEEATVTEGDAAAVAPRREAERTTARRIQTGNRISGHVKNFRGHRGLQSPQGDAFGHATQIDRGDRRSEGPHPLRLLSEDRIRPRFGAPIVELHRRYESSCGKTYFGL